MDKVVLPAEVTTFFQDWKARRRNFKILVIGDCWSGKTTLVNNLLGEEIVQGHAPWPSYIHGLSTFHGVFQGVPVTVHETSGLENPDAENDAGYMNELRALLSGGEVDVIIYCFKATETRIHISFSHALKAYHSMGLDWRKTVIALTIADALPIPNKSKQADSFNKADYFNERMDNWRDEIKWALTKHGVASSEEVKAIQMRPTQDDVAKHLPNDDPWYEPFWLCLLMCLKVAQLPSSTNVAHQLSVQHVTVPTDSEPIQTPPPSTNDDLPQSQTLACDGGRKAILSQKVHKHHFHLKLLRQHVSRNAAGKERQVLEGVGFDAAIIERCFQDNHLKGEAAVHAGLTKWVEGHKGHQPSTWKLLLEAMHYAEIPQQYIQSLEKDLGLP